MCLQLLLCLPLGARCSDNSEPLRDSPAPVVKNFDDTLRQINLKLVRLRIEFLERRIPWDQDTADLAESDGDPALASWLRAEAERFRKELPKKKAEERKLWEQQPGGITAPAPRPVRR